MVFEHIEKLKREYTDKYVVVDGSRPELRRFEGQTGQIKTVNMNGNALVEFDAYENIGWYDIGLDFLKVVDKPLPKEEKKPAAKKPAAKKPAADAPKKEAAASAAKPAAAKMSVAEMLAAARGEKSDGGAPPATAEKTEAKPEKAPAKEAGRSMSVAEMLAAARAEKSGDTATPDAAPEEGPAEAAAPESAAEPAAESSAEAPAEAAPAGDLPTDTAEILAYCRNVDG